MRGAPSRICAGGFTLVELMISMVLGLVVIGGAMGVILANRQSYRTNEGLSQVQESARTAFELLARDVRQAGVTGCDSTGRVANVLRPASLWWQDWFGMRGYGGAQADGAVGFGTSATPQSNRVSGTESLQVQGIEGTGMSISAHDAGTTTFTINATATTFANGDILLACDFDHATIFQANNYNSTNVTVGHALSTTPGPGNCTSGLGYPSTTACNGAGNIYSFGRNAQIARVNMTDWYIGDNGRANEGGRSLFRRRANATAPEEIVAGVTDMQLRYREAGNALCDPSFCPAGSVGNWTNVNAVRITLTIRSADQRVTTNTNLNSGRLERTFTNIITLRNRVP